MDDLQLFAFYNYTARCAEECYLISNAACIARQAAT